MNSFLAFIPTVQWTFYGKLSYLLKTRPPKWKHRLSFQQSFSSCHVRSIELSWILLLDLKALLQDTHIGIAVYIPTEDLLRSEQNLIFALVHVGFMCPVLFCLLANVDFYNNCLSICLWGWWVQDCMLQENFVYIIVNDARVLIQFRDFSHLCNYKRLIEQSMWDHELLWDKSIRIQVELIAEDGCFQGLQQTKAVIKQIQRNWWE